MTLRLRLFLLLAALVVLLVGAQAVLVRHLSARLDQDVRTVAVRVGEEILSGFHVTTTGQGGPAAAPAAGGAQERTRVMVFATTDADSPPAGPAAGGDGVDAPGESFQWVVRHELEVTPDAAAPGGHQIEERFEKRIVGKDESAAAGAHEERGEKLVRKLVIEAGHEPDVLFLRGPAQLARPIPIPRAEVSTTIDRFRSQLLAAALGVAALGLVAAALAADRIARPLKALSGAARRVGEGELGVEVPVARAAAAHDEIGVAVDSFNRMSRRLAELDAENRRLAESERLSELSEVARGLAHTLRNPLNALGLSVDALAARAAGGGGEGSADELVESSRRQIRRIDGALRSFLALASAGEAAAEAVDLATLVRETALEALQDGGGRVRIDVQVPEEPVTIRAVPAEVKAALQALVVNAVEASPAAARVVVTLVARAGGGGTIEVADEGPGLAAEVAARLFEPHVTTKPHGSGMGLFLAQRIAAGRYGGALALAPGEGGRGTRARLELGDRIAARSEGGT